MMGLWSACALVCTLLAGVTVWKRGELKEAQEEWSRIEPLVQEGTRISTNIAEVETWKDLFENDPLLMLPKRADTEEFLSSLLRICENAGIVEVHWKIGTDSGWVAPAEPAAKTGIDSKRDLQGLEKNSAIRKNSIELKFTADFSKLIELVQNIKNLKRYAQISTLDLVDNKHSVDVVLIVEFYHLERQP